MLLLFFFFNVGKQIYMSVQNGNTVAVHYRGTLESGEQFDSSYDRGEPITFQSGAGQMIAGFDNAVVGMNEGEKKTFTLSPEEAYGPTVPEALQDVPRVAFAPGLELVPGEMIQGQAPNGHPVLAKIVEVGENVVKLDMNHPLAGKTLTFDVEIVSIT